MSVWEKWREYQENTDQQKRLASARKAECTPLSIDNEACYGEFSGSNGAYTTTLEFCTCKDFAIKRMPCKHIYRLAIELGFIDGQANTDKTKIKVPPPANSYTTNEMIEILESLPIEAQDLFYEFLYLYIYKKKPNVGFQRSPTLTKLIISELFIEIDDYNACLSALPRNEINKRLINAGITTFKKNLSQKTLIEWCINNVTPEIFNDIIAVTLTTRTIKSRNKVYSYLKHKLYPDFIFNLETAEWEGL